MGRDEREGVANVIGEVFNYPSLYVADGALTPGPQRLPPLVANRDVTFALMHGRERGVRLSS